jgi:hypothetical protein
VRILRVIEPLHTNWGGTFRSHCLRAAIACSVLPSCHLIGVNPAEYLDDALPRLARGEFTTADVDAMLPARWKAQRAATAT